MKTNSLQSGAKVTHSILDGCRCSGTRKARKTPCQTVIVHDTVETPDLAIYSQFEAIQNGQIPTWNSPDITTNDWSPFRLMSEAYVTVRNLSATVPAINAQVHYFISPFGIGTLKELKLTKIINLAPNSEETLNFPLDAATLDGDPRVGVHIQIDHPHDSNMNNNIGSQVHDGGYTSESGRTFSIQVPVYNNSNMSQQIQLAILPSDVIATVSPDPTFENFAPHEQKIAVLNIHIPDFLHGTNEAPLYHEVTLLGRLTTGELIGGITRLIRINN